MRGSEALTATTTDDEIRQLRDVLRGLLGTDKVDSTPTVDEGWRSTWPALAELGVTAFCVPEEKDGFGFQVGAAVATAHELGAALHGSPFAGMTASAHALAMVGGDVADELLVGLVSGDRVCVFGLLDAVSGVARLVDGAAGADALLLLDRVTQELVLLDDPSGWRVDDTGRSFDVSRAAGDVLVAARAGHRLAGSTRARDLYGLLLAADAVGCVQRMLDRTVAYAAERVAFGRPIGSFQAVQHRLADHAIRTRGMSLAVADAAGLLGAGSEGAARVVALAEVSVSSNAAHILHDLLQLTGGIGFTWEYGLHLHQRRVHQDARLAANPRAAIRSLVDLEGWPR